MKKEVVKRLFLVMLCIGLTLSVMPGVKGACTTCSGGCSSLYCAGGYYYQCASLGGGQYTCCNDPNCGGITGGGTSTSTCFISTSATCSNVFGGVNCGTVAGYYPAAYNCCTPSCPGGGGALPPTPPSTCPSYGCFSIYEREQHCISCGGVYKSGNCATPQQTCQTYGGTCLAGYKVDCGSGKSQVTTCSDSYTLCNHYSGVVGACCQMPACTPTTWTPATSTKCTTEYFTQTSNCGTTRSVYGTKNCVCTGTAPSGAGVIQGSSSYTSGTYTPTAWTYSTTASGSTPCKWKCTTGYHQVGNTCVQDCTNICTNNQKRCNLNNVETCYDGNGDGCYEWITTTSNCQYGCVNPSSTSAYCRNPQNSQSDCSAAGGYWCGGATQNCLLPSTNGQYSCCVNYNYISDCSDASECTAAGGYWCGGNCVTTPCCSPSNLNLCNSLEQCTNQGGQPAANWWYGECHTGTCPCDTGHPDCCNGQAGCESSGGYWVDRDNNGQAECGANKKQVMMSETYYDILGDTKGPEYTPPRTGQDDLPPMVTVGTPVQIGFKGNAPELEDNSDPCISIEVYEGNALNTTIESCGTNVDGWWTVVFTDVVGRSLTFKPVNLHSYGAQDYIQNYQLVQQ